MLCGALTTGIISSNVKVASASTKITDLKILNPIEDLIKTTLDSEYHIMTDWKSRSGQDLISNKDLLKLYNKKNAFKSKWYEKVNLKIKDFNSDVKINNVYKTDNNTYMVDASYSVNFYVDETLSELSESRNEPHKFEIKDNNGKFTINKMIDIVDDIDITEQAEAKTKSNEELFENYDKRLSEENVHIDELNKNIDKYAKEVITNDNNEVEERNPNSRYSGYNSSSAVAYARKWAFSKNPGFNYYPDNDCQNFVSQSVYAGGVPGSAYWYNGHKNWTVVPNFFKYINDNGYTYGGTSSSSARVGDVVQLYNSGKAQWSHSMILTSKSSSGAWNYTAHTTDRKDFPLANAYPTKTFTKIRYIKFWH